MTHHNEEMRAAQTDGAGVEAVNDVVGGRGDDVETDTLAGRAHALVDHFHKEARVYPTLADAVELTGGASAWALGALTEVVPASTITSRFDVHHVHIREISAQTQYELILYQGAGDTEIARVPFEGIAGGKIDHVPVKTPIIPANARIRARLATKNGGSDTAEVKLMYHTYS